MKTDTPTITLTYIEGDPAGPWFMSTKLSDPPQGKGKYKSLKVVKGDDAVFTFKIATPKIAFNPDNPIEIRANDPKFPGDPGQFVPKLIKPDRLEVTNPNKDADPTDYYYQLNFVGKEPLDPIIQNGCCRSLHSEGSGMSMLSSPAAIAVVLLAAVALAVLVLKRRRTS